MGDDPMHVSCACREYWLKSSVNSNGQSCRTMLTAPCPHIHVLFCRQNTSCLSMPMSYTHACASFPKTTPGPGWAPDSRSVLLPRPGLQLVAEGRRLDVVTCKAQPFWVGLALDSGSPARSGCQATALGVPYMHEL
jgi:hypothetical protein